MTSLPSNLSTPQARRGHRHRRSAAISGDFDIGLGLSQSVSSTDNNIDKYFQFNNDDDFTKNSQDFSFPNAFSVDVPKTPDLTSLSTPPRYFPGSSKKTSLNSPIRMNNKKTPTQTPVQPTTRFFLTEETTLNNENVPDAVIDLDEILNSNLHIGEQTHRRADSFPEFSPNEFFNFSPHSACSPFQPIREQSSIKEEEPLEEEPYEEDSPSADEEEYVNPQESVGLYNNSSANSSSFSIKSNGGAPPSVRFASQLIEKTNSNSSKDSNNNLPPSKRSGAKANRYQSFYAQSYKITNALKFSSSESINIVRSSSGSSQSKSKVLGHSSSLPSLKSTKRPAASHSRFDSRYKDGRKITPTSHTTDQSTVVLTPSPSLNAPASPNFDASSVAPSKHLSDKHITNSPMSVTSEISSAVISTSETSTDHSSVLSQGDKKKDTGKPPSIVINKDTDSAVSSTNSTFKQDEDSIKSPNTPVVQEFSGDVLTSYQSSACSSPTKKKPLSPAQINLLKMTNIPPYQEKHRKSLTSSMVSQPVLPQSGRKYHHGKSKSMSMVFLDLPSEFNEPEKKKNSRLVNWFRKKR